MPRGERTGAASAANWQVRRRHPGPRSPPPHPGQETLCPPTGHLLPAAAGWLAGWCLKLLCSWQLLPFTRGCSGTPKGCPSTLDKACPPPLHEACPHWPLVTAPSKA